MWVSQNGWFISLKIPLRMDELGEPPFQETSSGWLKCKASNWVWKWGVIHNGVFLLRGKMKIVEFRDTPNMFQIQIQVSRNQQPFWKHHVLFFVWIEACCFLLWSPKFTRPWTWTLTGTAYFPMFGGWSINWKNCWPPQKVMLFMLIGEVEDSMAYSWLNSSYWVMKIYESMNIDSWQCSTSLEFLLVWIIVFVFFFHTSFVCQCHTPICCRSLTKIQMSRQGNSSGFP